MSKVLVIDNYDSFTYNLVHLLEGVGGEVIVVRNDELERVNWGEFNNILISPGPGIPSQIPQVKEVVLNHYKSKNILGVCLGHQLIAECFGQIIELSEGVFHGISSPINIIKEGKLFQNIPSQFKVGRYHSWLLKNLSNDEFEITAVSEEKIIMGFQHRSYSLYGIQFHPESILSEYGKEMIMNWLK